MSDDGIANLTVIQYHPHLAEYAWEVRRTLLGMEDRDLIIAVDLPQGLEQPVLNAVKKLPEVSLIIDPINRAIPIIPSSAPIEAVRCYLDLGLDLAFLDACFPICCDMAVWDKFQEIVARRGINWALDHAEENGFDLEEVIGIKKIEPLDQDIPLFVDIPELLPINKGSEPKNSAYFTVREEVMAIRLKKLLNREKPVVCVCDQIHSAGIISALYQDTSDRIDTLIKLPVRTHTVRRSEIPQITDEIPYHMYLYEIHRDSQMAVDRDSWNRELFADTGTDDDIDTIQSIIRFSNRIALSRGRRFPDLLSLLQASHCCTDEDSTGQLLRAALDYPFADEDSQFRVPSHTDYNLRRNPDPIDSEDLTQVPWDDLSWHQNNKACQEYRSRREFIFIERTLQSQREEQEVFEYFSKRYHPCTRGDVTASSTFLSGIGEGIAVRETIRNAYRKQIYVRDQNLAEKASYFFDFGGDPESRTWFLKKNLVVGMVEIEDTLFRFTHVIIFNKPIKDMFLKMDELDVSRPFESALKMAINHSEEVFLFSDSSPQIPPHISKGKRIDMIPLSAIPGNILKKVHEFHITGRKRRIVL
ncbi:MAG TPA: hypothetical protein VN372_04195 [Methanospirillum sp.]|nr:hypothetical protein [Methanospirillum sp.]